MKKFLSLIAVVVMLTSCERVAPNYYGVLMENYGKSGQSDYTLVSGKVNTMGMGTELFQVPAWEQRATFENSSTVQASDQTVFECKPSYSYKAMKESAVSLVFNNARLGSGEDFMVSLENKVLEPAIYDIVNDESRSFPTDTLMATGGNLRFENVVRARVEKIFKDKGLTLITFTSKLMPTEKVKNKIEARNEVNTNVSVIDQQIMEQRKKNELALLRAEENKIISSGITPQLLQQQFIDKWDGRTPLYGTQPITLFKNTQ